MADKPIIHPTRNIGDTVELIPGRRAGQRGPLKEILRTQGEDDKAQLLTLTIAGPPTYDSSLVADPLEARGPLFAVVEWGVRGAVSTVELDLPAGGLTMCLVASYVRVCARYDGLVLVNGAPIDPRAFGGQDAGPRQRVGAFVGYGSYGRASRLTRTFRLDNVPPAQPGETTVPGSSPKIRIPAFARHVTVTAMNPAGFALRLFGTDPIAELDCINMGAAAQMATVPLPGDCISVILDNYNLYASLMRPALTFDIAL